MKRVFWGGLTAILLLLFASAAFAVDGWASMNGGTTGGAGGDIVTVNSASQFESAVESTSTYIVEVLGTINLYSEGVDGEVDIRSNKTIRGVDSNATIIGKLGFRNDASNVIIKRLNITNPNLGDRYDGISIRKRVTNVFITKCTIYECGDGCIDITDQSDYITISWCKFYYTNPENYHRFTNLIGSSDDPDPPDTGKLNCTFHHNWWSDMCRARMPHVRFGKVHIYNNYYYCPGNDFCIRSDVEAQNLIENNYFNYVNDPIELRDAPTALIERHDNIFHGCSGDIDGGDDVFDPPYSYILDDANNVPFLAVNGAGADGNDMPHWLFGPYGDFTRDDTVDTEDLKYFAGYWLVDDCEQTVDADYDGDCTVDFYEFALMAENWRQE